MTNTSSLDFDLPDLCECGTCLEGERIRQWMLLCVSVASTLGPGPYQCDEWFQFLCSFGGGNANPAVSAELKRTESGKTAFSVQPGCELSGSFAL